MSTIMKFVTCIIAGLHLVKWFGVCSEVPTHNHSAEDAVNDATSESFENRSIIHFSNARNSDFSILENGTFEVEGLVNAEPVISAPLFEDTSWNSSVLKELNRKRAVPERGLTHESKMQILQLHNIYRGNVTPSAGNMAFMEWDEELSRLAQIWADGCLFDHGMPENDYPENIGQNLYIGTDPTGYLGLWLWYAEYLNYDLLEQHCIPDKQCGHYVQMAWAASNKLGCGMRKCGMRYYLTCHYSPQALKGIQMYHVAKPCSQCSSKNGALCLKNLCLTWEQCKQNPFDCQFAGCDLECHNCGQVDTKNCLCKCADGWDSPDCSHPCENKHPRCGKSPGWPTKAACSLNRHAVAETYCRQMCEMCNPLDIKISNHTCCNGTLCDEKYILHPIDKSYEEEEGQLQASLHSRGAYLAAASISLLWTTLLWTNEIYRRKYI